MAAIAFNSLFVWAPTTVFTGTGTADISFTSTTTGISIASIHARVQKSAFLDFDKSNAVESGGLIGMWEPITYIGTGHDEQCGTSTFSTGTKTVTFATAFATAPDFCACNDTAGAATVCSWTGTSATTTANFVGTGSNTFAWCCKAKKN